MEKHRLEFLIDQYLGEKDITKRLFDLYITIFRQYTDYLVDNFIQYSDKTDVIHYINLKNQGYSNNWLYLQISTVKAFYKYLNLNLNQIRLNLPEVFAYDITESIRNVSKKPRISTPVLTVEQAKQLLTYTRDNRRYIWHLEIIRLFI